MATDSEKEIAKYAAQIYQHKVEKTLSGEELELIARLVKHGYMRPSTNGFCGSMTDKAMIRGMDLDEWGQAKTPFDIPRAKPPGKRFG